MAPECSPLSTHRSFIIPQMSLTRGRKLKRIQPEIQIRSHRAYNGPSQVFVDVIDALNLMIFFTSLFVFFIPSKPSAHSVLFGI